MPTFFLLIWVVLITTAAAAAATLNRRVLHQPFITHELHPPTQPPAPQPPTPKYPFSTSTPTQQPFFPNSPAPPTPPSPPPPRPSTFASYPANISSLILPQSAKSKPHSTKLVAVAATLAVCASFITASTVFLYIRRRRRRGLSDSKNYGSESSVGVFPAVNARTVDDSEFLYLGNIVSTHRAIEGNASGSGGGGRNLGKLDSPELRPLPPLNPPCFQQICANVEVGSANCANAEVGSGGDEEEEEFFSPRGSSICLESSIGTGSASRRAFTAENFERETTSSRYSSSNAASPVRSSPKLPKSEVVQTGSEGLRSSPSPSPPSSSSPESVSDKSLDSSPRVLNVSAQNAGGTQDLSPRTSNVSYRSAVSIAKMSSPLLNELGNLKSSPARSPSLSLCSSPERYLKNPGDLSPRTSNVSSEDTESPERTAIAILNHLANERLSRSSSFSSVSSPERPVDKEESSSQNLEPLERISSPVKKNSRSSSSLSSPERTLEKNPDSPLRICGSSGQNLETAERISSPVKNSRSPSLSSMSSPERTSYEKVDSPLRICGSSGQNMESPERIGSHVFDQAADEDNSRSPSLSPLSSPENTFEKKPDSSLKMWFSSRNAESSERISSPVLNQAADNEISPSPSLSSLSSPERSLENTPDASPRISSTLSQNVQFPEIISSPVVNQAADKENYQSPSLSPLSSPERSLEKNSVSSPRISSFSGQNVRSPERISSPVLNQAADEENYRSPSLSPLSSPERNLEKNLVSSPRISNFTGQNIVSPERIISSVVNEAPDKENYQSQSVSPLTSTERTLEINPDCILGFLSQNVESRESISSPILNQAAAKKNSLSPSLSPFSSPERTLEKNADLSPQRSSVSSQTVDSHGIISSPVLNQAADEENSRSPPLSPSCFLERSLEENTDLSPGRSSVSSQSEDSPERISSPVLTQADDVENSQSPPLFSSLCSPEENLERNQDLSPRRSSISSQNLYSPESNSSSVLDQVADKNDSISQLLSSLSFSGRSFQENPDSSLQILSVSGHNLEPPEIISSFALNQVADKEISPVSSRDLECPKIVSSPVLNQVADEENSRSLLLSSLSLGRPLEENNDLSPRRSSASVENVDSPERISSPMLNQVADKKHSPSPSPSSLSSPEKPLDKNPYSSPRTATPLSPNVESPEKISSPMPDQLLSSSSSPERSFLKAQDSSPRVSNTAVPNMESPAKISSAVFPVCVEPPPPPPPPPPPLLSPKDLESPVSTSKPKEPILQASDLVKPSRPVTICSPKMISPIELPPSSGSSEKNDETPKLKLKPLHWDKVRASSDREMVWDQLKSSSFKLDEEMIETLFVVNAPNSNPNEPARRPILPPLVQENRVLDPKKAQNIAISLRALNVTSAEVCEALSEGNAEALGIELLESLLKMAPNKEEERRLKEYTDDSPFKLGPAERFLKTVLDVPFAFTRVDALLYISNFESEVEYLKKSFETLEAACEELRNSRMFLKLLEAVLKTGNRMNVGTNRGDAQAFKLDTLLKLVDVKGVDGRTTLLHFVVQEIIRTEGSRLTYQNSNFTFYDDAKCRKLGLQVVSGLTSELTNVKKAAAMDSDVLSSEVMKLSRGIGKIEEVVQLNEEMGPEKKNQNFLESMNRFVKMAEEEIFRIQAHENVALSLVKEITEYFHGNSAKEEAHPFRIFMVVRDFLTILDRVCKEVGMINERTIISSAHKFPVPVNPMLQPWQTSMDDESSFP